MPQALRSTTRYGAVVALALIMALGLSLVRVSDFAAEASPTAEQRMVELINAERSSRGLGRLHVSSELVGVARDWSNRMAAESKLYHRPNLADVVKADWTRLGENVGRTNQSGATEQQLVDRLNVAFMNSPGHRDNVLGAYNQVGVGVTRSADGTMWMTVNFMQASLPAPAPAPAPAPTYTGNPNAAIDEAARISQAVFASHGTQGRTAEYVVLGRAEVFADALGGSGLAADKAPVLFTTGPTAANPNPGLDGRTRAEIDRILGGRGTVYLLGGTAAVSDQAAKDLAAAGYQATRLSGRSRVETAVRVAQEIVARHGTPREILVARADDWPDAVSGGAYAAATGSPLLLTGKDGLHPAAAAFLAAHSGARRWALGGTAALSDGVVSAAGATRVSGRDRAGTAVAVAERMWGRTAGTAGDRFTTAPGYGADAWAYALALAPVSAAHSAPQLLVSHEVPASVRDYLDRLNYGGGITVDMFSASAVPASVTESLRQLVR